jgi:hypothetical protein
MLVFITVYAYKFTALLTIAGQLHDNCVERICNSIVAYDIKLDSCIRVSFVNNKTLASASEKTDPCLSEIL